MDESTLALGWNLILTSKSRNQAFNMIVDATSGEVLIRRCLTMYISDASYRVYTSDSPSPFSPGLATPATNQPAIVARDLVVTNAFNTNASPNGWIDDGVNETMGNNVDSHLDVDDDDQPDLPRPQGNPNRVFDFGLDLTIDPTNSPSAAVVQLFYLATFTTIACMTSASQKLREISRSTTSAGAGCQNDPILADAQDGGGVDNAYFMPMPDGVPGRMTVNLMTGPTPRRDPDYDAEVIYHELTHGLSWRLVGGGMSMYEEQSTGLGEGWSDWFAITLLSRSRGQYQWQLGQRRLLWLHAHGIGPAPLTQNYYFGNSSLSLYDGHDQEPADL